MSAPKLLKFTVHLGAGAVGIWALLHPQRQQEEGGRQLQAGTGWGRAAALSSQPPLGRMLNGDHLRCRPAGPSGGGGGSRGRASPAARPLWHHPERLAHQLGPTPSSDGPGEGQHGAEPHAAQSDRYCLRTSGSSSCSRPLQPGHFTEGETEAPPKAPQLPVVPRGEHRSAGHSVPQDRARTSAWPSSSPHHLAILSLIRFMPCAHSHEPGCSPSSPDTPPTPPTSAQSPHRDASPAHPFPRRSPLHDLHLLCSRPGQPPPARNTTGLGTHRGLQKRCCAVSELGAKRHCGFLCGHSPWGGQPPGSEGAHTAPPSGQYGEELRRPATSAPALQTRARSSLRSTSSGRHRTAASGEIRSQNHPAKPKPIPVPDPRNLRGKCWSMLQALNSWGNLLCSEG